MMITLFRWLFRKMWKVNSCISTADSIAKGSYPKRYARKKMHKATNKLMRKLF